MFVKRAPNGATPSWLSTPTSSYVRRFSNLSSSVRRWTRLHGYDALRTRGFDLRDNDARWQKYPLLVMLRGGYERVVFIDYDALVFRHDLPADFFREAKADVIGAQSSFLIKTTGPTGRAPRS